MVVTYEDVIPSLIPNTTMKKRFYDGVHRQYVIEPNDGYVLHDAENDEIIIDPDTMEETKHLWYVSGDTTCGANYDFSPVTVTDENGVEFTAYGEREFAARLIDEVPADQIFGLPNNDHEIM